MNRTWIDVFLKWHTSRRHLQRLVYNVRKSRMDVTLVIRLLKRNARRLNISTVTHFPELFRFLFAGHPMRRVSILLIFIGSSGTPSFPNTLWCYMNVSTFMNLLAFLPTESTRQEREIHPILWIHPVSKLYLLSIYPPLKSSIKIPFKYIVSVNLF